MKERTSNTSSLGKRVPSENDDPLEAVGSMRSNVWETGKAVPTG